MPASQALGGERGGRKETSGHEARLTGLYPTSGYGRAASEITVSDLPLQVGSGIGGHFARAWRTAHAGLGLAWQHENTNSAGLVRG